MKKSIESIGTFNFFRYGSFFAGNGRSKITFDISENKGEEKEIIWERMNNQEIIDKYLISEGYVKMSNKKYWNNQDWDGFPIKLKRRRKSIMEITLSGISEDMVNYYLDVNKLECYLKTGKLE